MLMLYYYYNLGVSPIDVFGGPLAKPFAAHQWSLAHRLRTSDLQCSDLIPTSGPCDAIRTSSILTHEYTLFIRTIAPFVSRANPPTHTHINHALGFHVHILYSLTNKQTHTHSQRHTQTRASACTLTHGPWSM